MKEKIIIDGVDVAGCEFYFEDNGVIAPDGTPERANICTSPEKSCENNDSCYCNKDCYYKQLKRLEQENKELKKYKNLFFKMKEFHFDERINNEKILKENEDLKDSIKRFTCQSECLRYKQYQQAKQALEEIKGIANQTIIDYTEIAQNNEKLKALDLRSRMINIQKIIYKAVRV